MGQLLYSKAFANALTRMEAQKNKSTLSLTKASPLYLSLIAAEDHRFSQHSGVDLIALIRAFWRTVFCRKREGGSTIAMQLVRVLTQNYDISLSRKFTEIVLARELTKRYSQLEIVEAYLSIAYFGWDMHGLERAIDQLGTKIAKSEDEAAASLIARLKYPQPRYRTTSHDQKLDTRTKYILAKRLNIEQE